jgi:hypothetical protein
MPIEVELVKTILIAAVILFYAGFGASLWLTPVSLEKRFYMMTPFAGLYFVDAISHYGHYANLAGSQTIWLLLAITSLINLSAIIWRRPSFRWPNRGEVYLLLIALPALVLVLAPMLPQKELLVVGGYENSDPVAHAFTTDWVRENGYDTEINQNQESPLNVRLAFKVKGNIRLGFHFYQMYVDLISGLRSYATYSIVVAIGFYLWSVATGFFAMEILHLDRRAAYLSTLLLAISTLPLSIAVGGYGPHTLGMGLLIMAYGLWALALQGDDWRLTVLAAALSAAFVGIYSDVMPYLVIGIGMLATMYAVRFFRNHQYARVSRIAKITVAGAALSLALNPIGWYRAVARVLDIAQRSPGGNISWWVDLRQVAGLVPFGRDITQSLNYWELTVFWVVAIVLVSLMVYGFLKLDQNSKLITIAFLLPHFLSLLWFVFNSHTYQYYKGWATGWFIYIALLANGMVALTQQSATKRPMKVIAIGVSLLVVIFFARSSIKFSTSMNNRLALTPEIIELGRWSDALDMEQAVFVDTGDLRIPSAYWIGYFLADRAVHMDVPVVYTPYKGQKYDGEPWVIRYGDSPLEEPPRNWHPTFWQENIIEQNDDFALLTLEPVGGRKYDVPAVQQAVNANVGGLFNLIGYDIVQSQIKPGDQLQFTLYWLTEKKSERAYKFFLHLFDQNGELVEQVDWYPLGWTYHTHFWLPDEVVTDQVEFPIRHDLPPGSYTVKLGLYLEETGERLSVVQDGVQSPDKAMLLQSMVISSG